MPNDFYTFDIQLVARIITWHPDKNPSTDEVMLAAQKMASLKFLRCLGSLAGRIRLDGQENSTPIRYTNPMTIWTSDSGFHEELLDILVTRVLMSPIVQFDKSIIKDLGYSFYGWAIKMKQNVYPWGTLIAKNNTILLQVPDNE